MTGRMIELRSLLLAGGAVVIATACTSAIRTAPVVQGISVNLRAAATDTVIYRRSITRSGKDTSAGTRQVVQQRHRDRSRGELLELVQVFPGGGGTIVDTAVADFGSLGAVSHASHQPSKTMRFEFDSSNATGTVVPTTGAAESVHQALGGRIFDSNIIEIVVSALPLKTGFSTVLPFFIYERGGRVPMPVAVRERAMVEFPAFGRRDAWVVTVGVPGAPATIWVDAKTRAVLRTRYDIAAQNLSFTDDRITPLGKDAA